jgi:hypothetical protein
MTKALNSQSAQRPAVNFVWMEIETFDAIGDSHNPSITLAGAGPRLGMGKFGKPLELPFFTIGDSADYC